MYQTTTTDPIGHVAARIAVWSLIGLALWANVAQIERPSQAQAEQSIIILEATATPALPTAIRPALAIEQPTAIPDALPAPEIIAPAPVAAELPAPVWTEADFAPPPVAVVTEAPPPAPDPALTYGTPEFNAALVEAHQDLPVLECPCGVDTTPAQPTAKDYAYSKARTR